MLIQRKTVDSRILTSKFACDLQACRGACCTFPGGAGAPVLPEELPYLEKAKDAVWLLLPEEHKRVIGKYGLFEQEAGGITLRCYNQRACVFVTYRNGIAVCSIQEMFERGGFDWPKPQSCHLFPIRVRGSNRDLLVYEEFAECDPALESGEERNIGLVDFLKPAIVRVFGSSFFSDLERQAGANAS
jgi:hypothetical protein